MQAPYAAKIWNKTISLMGPAARLASSSRNHTSQTSMTGSQRSYLKTLSEEAHESFDENLTKAEASKRIEELQEKTGRGGSGAGRKSS
jgi:Protein of unknown function (DUF3072)